MRPRKRFGQNFLCDAAIIGRIGEVLDLKTGDAVIEIGPGQGALTQPFLTVLPRLLAVEIDRDLIGLLEERFGDALVLRNEDALKLDLVTWLKSLAIKDKVRIVGNLPYNISTPLLFHLLLFVEVIKDMHFMLQKEVVARMAAKPHTADYGRLSVMLQYHCDVEALFDVPPHAFYPAPKVTSAFVRLIPKPSPLPVTDFMLFQNIVRSAFSFRRKTISNALRAYLSAAQFNSIGIHPKARAQELTLEDFVRISNALASSGRQSPDCTLV